MKKTWLLIAGIALLIVAAVLMVNSANNQSVTAIPNATQSVPQGPAPRHEHSPGAAAKTLPAHFEVPPSKSSLGPTLDPGSFTGITRDAYRAAREIPVTLAQLPCYCHCDQGFGHKSLYSCFESEHASHCAVCVNEALLAHKLDKEGKLTPAQIRDRIVEQFGQ